MSVEIGGGETGPGSIDYVVVSLAKTYNKGFYFIRMLSNLENFWTHSWAITGTPTWTRFRTGLRACPLIKLRTSARTTSRTTSCTSGLLVWSWR